VADQTDVLSTVRAGYAFAGPVLELGALVDGDLAAPAAHADAPVRVPLSMLNRHGLVAGATGTGKTKTLQLMAEQLSAAGVPVFLADVKGDLSGVAAPGQPGARVTARATEVGQQWAPTGFPVEFLALGGLGSGVPVRATVTGFGPLLLSKVLGLNETQESSLGLVFHYADQAGLPILDLKDLRAVISYLVSDEGKKELESLGGLSKQTAGVILRELISFQDQGAEAFFGEPEFDPMDLLRQAPDGRGVVSCLELSAVQDRPALFSTFLMWLLAELFEQLPEVGDVDQPKLVFFFDEAHLLFDGASKDFLDAVTRTVRLIRSKGVGIFFVTQTPKDMPSDVLAQLGNRVQHALRAFTPDDAKALKATVSTFPRSGYDLEELLPALGIGEAVVTVLTERGTPSPVAWTRLRAPQSLMAQADPAVVAQVVGASPLQAEYGQAVDRDSAYERLAAKLAPPPAPAAPAPAPAPSPAPVEVPDLRREPAGRSGSGGFEEGAGGMVGAVLGNEVFGQVVNDFARSAARSLGREITRSIFGTPRRRRR
jgi:hypothetical protein